MWWDIIHEFLRGLFDIEISERRVILATALFLAVILALTCRDYVINHRSGFDPSVFDAQFKRILLFAVFLMICFFVLRLWGNHAPVNPEPSCAKIINPDNDTNMVNLRQGPGIEHPIIGGYFLDTQIKVLSRDETGNWLEVEASDRGVGWIYIYYVELDNSSRNSFDACF